MLRNRMSHFSGNVAITRAAGFETNIFRLYQLHMKISKQRDLWKNNKK